MDIHNKNVFTLYLDWTNEGNCIPIAHAVDTGAGLKKLGQLLRTIQKMVSRVDYEGLNRLLNAPDELNLFNLGPTDLNFVPYIAFDENKQYGK